MLANRIALVTGSARGIGESIGRVLAREGAKVTISDLNFDACHKVVQSLESPENHLPSVLDVTQKESIWRAFDQVKSKYAQPPEIVVNSAGIILPKWLLKMEEEDFDSIINVNLKGTFLVNQISAQFMKEAGISGNIVNISSIAAKAGYAGHSNYTASKNGVIALTKSASKELAKFGIRVNCICPGFIQQTGMSDIASEEIIQMIKATIPMGDFGYPVDIAETVAFLVSSKAKYITGAVIDVNGGLL